MSLLPKLVPQNHEGKTHRYKSGETRRAGLDEDIFEKFDFESMIVVLRGCLGERFQIQ